MEIFARIFVSVFTVGAIFLGTISYSVFSRPLPSSSPRDLRDLELSKALPPGYVESQILNPFQSKKGHFFWGMRPLNSRGAAIRVLQDPKIFTQVFPGYSNSIALDKVLVDRLFSETMVVRDWVLLPPPAPGFLLSHPTFAEGEIFKRYGADILIFGNSETSRAIAPGFLQSGLSGTPAILALEASGSTLRVDREISERLSSSGKRAKWSILGISLSNFFFHSKVAQFSEQNNLAALSPKSSLQKLLDWRLETFFPTNSWDPFRPTEASTAFPNGFSFSASWVGEPSTINGRLSSQTHHWRPKTEIDIFDSIDESDCQMKKASQELDQTLASLLKFSDHVLIFLTPANALELNRLPECFFQSALQLITSKSSERVYVLGGAEADYGLGLSDYISINPSGQTAYLDQSHLNAEGARSFTKLVSSFLSGAQGAF